MKKELQKCSNFKIFGISFFPYYARILMLQIDLNKKIGNPLCFDHLQIDLIQLNCSWKLVEFSLLIFHDNFMKIS